MKMRSRLSDLKNNFKQSFSKVMALIAVLLTIIIPYFQPLQFEGKEKSDAVGFPLKYLTVRKELSGHSLFDTFHVDAGSFILSAVIIYLVMYFLYFLWMYLKTRNKRQ